jgi:hypothetical protein
MLQALPLAPLVLRLPVMPSRCISALCRKAAFNHHFLY